MATRTWQYHKDNAALSTNELIDKAVDEFYRAIERQNRKQPAIRMCVPPQADDTDLLIIDALHRAQEEIARMRSALECVEDYAFHPESPRVNASEMDAEQRLAGAGGQAEFGLARIPEPVHARAVGG